MANNALLVRERSEALPILKARIVAIRRTILSSMMALTPKWGVGLTMVLVLNRLTCPRLMFTLVLISWQWGLADLVRRCNNLHLEGRCPKVEKYPHLK
jgi:hypothetical protein